MTSGRGPRICLTAIFLALIGVIAPSQVLLEWRAGDTPQIADLFRQMPTRANLRRLENDLESRCRLAQAVRPWVQCARFVTLQDAGDKALLGRCGWFFYRPAVQYLVEPCPLTSRIPGGTPKRSLRVDSGIRAKPSPRPAALTMPPGMESRNDVITAIVSFRDDLAQRGIKLLVMPAPNKASVYPELLCARAGAQSDPVNPTTREVLAELQQAGVEVVDLFNVYGQGREAEGAGCYLAQDSHWSPEGMRLAADVVARRLLDSDWVRKGPVTYETKAVILQRYGDVLRMMRVPQVLRLYEPEHIECTQVIDTHTGKPYVDDPNSPVLVLGDSFLRIFERDEPGSSGFIAHLARNLGFGLTSVVNDGGASTLVRQQLARKPALLAGKKVVVWEFVERDIRFGTEGWQVVSLP
ncbi:MAG: hypothetical protein MUC88_01655 [Planctomycetes bacterium]|nr:hypothetical protein [Planctomycetota bacterium]